MLKRLLIEEEGQALVEYGFTIILITMVCIIIVTVFGKKVRDYYVRSNTAQTSTS